MARMANNIGKGIVDGLFHVFGQKKATSGLVRMFETEYSSEARFARRAGVTIDDNYVRSFLSAHSK